MGYLVRKYGLSIDDLLAAEIVVADGHKLPLNAETNPDLFWAIRGGEGNFGVITRLQFRLHELKNVYGGMLVLPATAKVIAGFWWPQWSCAGGAVGHSQHHARAAHAVPGQ